MSDETLIALGIAPEQVAEMLSIPLDWLSDENGDPKKGID
jgi:hypothetical protein